MEQHPIPRQVTTFEFKLIGFLTLKQFIYVLIFVPIGILVYFLVPIAVLNALAGLAVTGIGFIFAMVPIQDRPMSEWLKNLYKRLTSPTQYVYHKENKPLYFMKDLDLYFTEDPHRVLSHIESKDKLAAYLQSTKGKSSGRGKHKTHVQTLLQHPTKQLKDKQFIPSGQHDASHTTSQPAQVVQTQQSASRQGVVPAVASQKLRHPFFTGLIKNNKKIPLPGVLVYIKDMKDNVLRIVKTNPHGVFASYLPLPAGEYKIEIKDPNKVYFFDTMTIHIEDNNPRPFEFFSKELL